MKRWVVITVLLLLASIVFIFRTPIWSALKLVLGGAVISFLLLPFHAWLERRVRRGHAISLVFFYFFMALLVLFGLFIPAVVSQAQILLGMLPNIIDSGIAWFDKIQEMTGIPLGIDKQSLFAGLSGFINSAVLTLGSLTRLFADFLLMVILAYYFMRDRENISGYFALLIPLRYRGFITRMLANIRADLMNYIRGQLLVSFITGMLTGIALLIVGVPGAFMHGVIMAFFDLIPYFGPFIGAIPILIFASTEGKFIISAIVILIVQQIEGGFLAPRIAGRTTGVHPALVLILLTLGGGLMGIWGLLLAMPITIAFIGVAKSFDFNKLIES